MGVAVKFSMCGAALMTLVACVPAYDQSYAGGTYYSQPFTPEPTYYPQPYYAQPGYAPPIFVGPEGQGYRRGGDDWGRRGERSNFQSDQRGRPQAPQQQFQQRQAPSQQPRQAFQPAPPPPQAAFRQRGGGAQPGPEAPPDRQ